MIVIWTKNMALEEKNVWILNLAPEYSRQTGLSQNQLLCDEGIPLSLETEPYFA